MRVNTLWLPDVNATEEGREDRRAPRSTCAQRGYCGPFVNQAYFNSLETWAGFGICVECGCTVPVPPGERSFGNFERWASHRSTPTPRP